MPFGVFHLFIFLLVFTPMNCNLQTSPTVFCNLECPNSVAVTNCCQENGFATGECTNDGDAMCYGVGRIWAGKRSNFCDVPCRIGGDTPLCCRRHGFDGGHCVYGDAYCTFDWST